MPSKPTGRPAGRPPGLRNKATIERELRAEQEMAARVIDRARNGDTFELARDVLGRMMRLAEGAAGLHKPPDASDKVGSWPLFGEWFDRTVYCAKALAEYESPKQKAHTFMPTPQMGPQVPTLELTAKETKDPQAATQTYLRLVKS